VRDDEQIKGVLLADGTELSTDVVVNAAGPWSRALNEMANVLGDFETSTQAMEQEVISLPAPPGFGVDDGGLGVHDSDFATYFRPHPGGTIIVGSFEPECDPQTFLEKPEDARPSPSAENWEVQSPACSTTARAVDPEPEIGNRCVL
jgi:sarcosine oxidase subunit beta